MFTLGQEPHLVRCTAAEFRLTRDSRAAAALTILVRSLRTGLRTFRPIRCGRLALHLPLRIFGRCRHSAAGAIHRAGRRMLARLARRTLRLRRANGDRTGAGILIGAGAAGAAGARDGNTGAQRQNRARSESRSFRVHLLHLLLSRRAAPVPGRILRREQAEQPEVPNFGAELRHRNGATRYRQTYANSACRFDRDQDDISPQVIPDSIAIIVLYNCGAGHARAALLRVAEFRRRLDASRKNTVVRFP
ncbi:hypothetical protein ACVWXO_005883 [Bradyrhizobium sp. LM2.7]